MTGIEGNVTPRLSPGAADEFRDAWAFIGVCAALWWAGKHLWRVAVRSAR